MKTILISLITFLSLTINLLAATHNESINSDSKIKQTVAFSISAEEVAAISTAIETGELERKDISRIAFKNNINEVTESAIHTDLKELSESSAVTFKLNIREVVEKINHNQALKELVASEIAFSLDVTDAVENSALADLSDLTTGNNPVAFSLDIEQVIKWTNDLNTQELLNEDLLLADNE